MANRLANVSLGFFTTLNYIYIIVSAFIFIVVGARSGSQQDSWFQLLIHFPIVVIMGIYLLFHTTSQSIGLKVTQKNTQLSVNRDFYALLVLVQSAVIYLFKYVSIPYTVCFIGMLIWAGGTAFLFDTVIKNARLGENAPSKL